MKKYTSILVGIILWNFSSVLTIADEPKISKELEEIAEKYAEATAYFEIAESALVEHYKNNKESLKSDLKNRVIALTNIKKNKEDAMVYSLLLATEGRTKEMGAEVTNARIELNKKRMLKEIDNRNENISILINKYSESSKELMDKPPEELQKLIDKKLEDSESQKDIKKAKQAAPRKR